MPEIILLAISYHFLEICHHGAKIRIITTAIFCFQDPSSPGALEREFKDIMPFVTDFETAYAGKWFR